MSETLFVSDVHLDATRPAIIDLFNAFIAKRASNADALYILGDLFEYWIGDDAPHKEYSPTFKALNKITDSNVPVYFMHGNRDFLIASEFARKTGVSLLPDEQVINLYDKRILLMHGDTLCTDDIAYQKFRKKTHNRCLQWLVLHLPLRLRTSIADHLRETSRQAILQKPADIMDVNSSAVEAAMQRNNAKILIHGHTHRPAIHTHKINGEELTRVVLGDWYAQGSVLRITENEMLIENFTSVN